MKNPTITTPYLVNVIVPPTSGGGSGSGGGGSGGGTTTEDDETSNVVSNTGYIYQIANYIDTTTTKATTASSIPTTD